MLVKLCECGCGQATAVAKLTNSKKGYVKGQPRRFVKGHNSRVYSAPIEERLKNFKVDSKTKCHLWLGNVDFYGYPRISFENKVWRVTRLLWILKVGDPGELHVLHRCDNPPCVNLKHLFLGTQQDNIADMMKKGRHVSTKGHSKYPEGLLAAAKKAWLSGTKTQAQVAADYGIPLGTLSFFISKE